MSPLAPQRLASLCVECGPNVALDEDGCCALCGNSATGTWLDMRWRRLAGLLEPKRKPLRRKPKPKEKRQATADVRAEVLARARGHCECGCGRPFVLGGPELDHFFGRARAESVQSCWALRSDCHYRKTNNAPSAAAWLERFRAFAIRHGYWEEAKKAGRRLAYVQARTRLGERLKVGGARHG